MVEFADRKMAEGYDRRDAYQEAVNRMFWPITASIATTLMVFLPLMFWPGVAGEFMRYLPITVFSVLIGSLLYALLFVPTIGALFGRAPSAEQEPTELHKLESGDMSNVSGITGLYAGVLRNAVRMPIVVFLASVGILATIATTYFSLGRGVEFFTSVEPNQTQIEVFARGNYSPEQIRDIVRQVESRIRDVGHFENIVTQTGSGQSLGGGQGSAPDLVGTIFLEFTDRSQRELDGFELEQRYREAVRNLPGITAEINSPEQGPPVGKELQLELYGNDLQALNSEANRIREHLESGMEGLIDIDDTTPIPGIEWRISVDRARASISGASIGEVGSAVQLLTNGVRIGDYRPDDSEEEVEVRARYPERYRGIERIDDLRISTPTGQIPISSFIEREPARGVSTIERVNGVRVVYVRANPAPGVVTSNKVEELRQWLQANPPEPGVNYRFRGANEEQQQSFTFLMQAFGLALALMAILLVTQFNSYYQALLILSSVLLSTAGVLLGLVVTGQTFSVILTGVGIIALAGIIVNNNIVLIDTFNHLRSQQRDRHLHDILVQTGVQRLRPVLLTTFTTGCGLLPLAMHVSVDLIGSTIERGGPVTSQWVPLASAIVWGLGFGTILTLIVTPAMLALPHRLRELFGHLRQRLQPGT